MDEEEDRLYGPDRRGDELPVELSKKESRLARLRDAMQRLEEKQQDQKLPGSGRSGRGRWSKEARSHCQGSRVQGFDGAEAFDEAGETGL